MASVVSTNLGAVRLGKCHLCGWDDEWYFDAGYVACSCQRDVVDADTDDSAIHESMLDIAPVGAG